MIDHFRAHWTGEDDAERSARALMSSPGRAAGKVAYWALERTAMLLKRYSRRPLMVNAVGATDITANELSVLALIEAMAAGDVAAARRHATWLVTPQATDRLLDRLQPVADLYPELSRAA